MTTEMISVSEASKRADLSPDHLKRLIRAHRITAQKVETPVGFYWMVDWPSLEHYLHTPELRKPGVPRGTKRGEKKKRSS